MKWNQVLRIVRRSVITMSVGLSVGLSVACGGGDSGAPDSLTIVAYDSFTPPDGAFDGFTADTGIQVRILRAGDAGEMVAKAVLTAGNPEGDVMWGVDNTLLRRAIDGGVFDPYSSGGDDLAVELVAITDEVTPVDFGDVCVNYDRAALNDAGVSPPENLDDLVRPEYAGMLVVQDPTTSSTGLAFMLATRAAFGDDWISFWQQLVDQEVLVVDSWDDAYYSAFTRYGGDRPLVVSYATSPPAEVLFADPPLPEGSPAPTGVVVGTCFRQVEFAGVLRGTDHPDEARALVDFLSDREFQALLPESIFVHPANTAVELPESFDRYAPVVESPWSMDPDDIAAGVESWLDVWSATVG